MVEELFRGQIRFEKRPSPVLPEHRPMYKIGQILLILKLSSRGGSSSLPRLQLFNWALKSMSRKSDLLRAVESGHLEVPAWGFDPAPAIAVRIAIAEGLLEQGSKSYKISPLGDVFVKDLLKDSALFVAERAFLTKIGKGLTEKMVDDTARRWMAN